MARHNNYGDLLRLAATKQFSKYRWNLKGGGGGLDILLNLIEEQYKQKEDVLTLGNALYKMFKDRRQQMDIKHLTGLQNYKILYGIHGHSKSHRTNNFSYNKTCIPLTHLLFSPHAQSSSNKIAGTRRMHVQPTAIFRRQEGHKGKQNGTKWQTTKTYSHAVSRLI